MLELPAGLVGDDGSESTLEAAARELREETGYEAPVGNLAWLMSGPSSAGLTDEIVDLVIATDVRRVGPGGGVSGERIDVTVVPLEDLEQHLLAKAAEGVAIDFKVRLVPLLAKDSSLIGGRS